MAASWNAASWNGTSMLASVKKEERRQRNSQAKKRYNCYKRTIAIKPQVVNY